MSYARLMILTLLCIGPSVIPQPAAAEWTSPVVQETLTLAEAQNLALQRHPQLLAERFNLDAAREAVNAARAGYLPQISAFADRVFAGSNTRIGATPGLTDPTVIDRGSVGVTASQLVTDFGKTDDLVESARYGAEAQREETAETANSVLLNVTGAYYGVLRAQALLKVADETVNERATLLRRVQAMRDARLKSDLDVSIAQQVVDQANLLHLTARGDLETARAALAEALGSSTIGNGEPVDDHATPPPPTNLEALVEQAMSGNPELAATKESAQAASKLAASARDAFLPTVSVLGYAGYNPLDDPAQRIERSYFAGGIALTLPLYEGGLLQAQEREANAKAEAATQTADETQNRLAQDVETAFAAVNTAYDKITVTDHLVTTARISLRLMQAGFELGRNSVVDLSQAELATTEAEIDAADARYQYLSRLAALEFVTGDFVQDSSK